MHMILGGRVAADVQFRVGGVLRDSDVITARLRAPDGAMTVEVYPTANLTRVEAGRYRYEFTANLPGLWAVRFEATGQIEAVGEGVIAVAPSFVL